MEAETDEVRSVRPVPQTLAARVRGGALLATAFGGFEVLVLGRRRVGALLAVPEGGHGPVPAVVHANRVGGYFVGEPPVGDLHKK